MRDGSLALPAARLAFLAVRGGASFVLHPSFVPRTALAFAFTSSLVLVACGDDAGGADASPDAGGDAGGFAVTPPAAPTLPELACPTGWDEVALGEVSYCEPFPSGVRGCEIDQAQLPGEEGCVLIGTACPADGWPTDLPAADVLYVDGTASGAGDGSRAAPFVTIDEALDVASSGATIALRAGTYDELVFLPSGVTLRGACTRATVVGAHSPTLSSLGRIDTDGTDVRVENLRVTGSRPGLWVRPGGSMTVRDVVVDDARIAGVVVQGEMDAEDLAVRSTRTSVDGLLGHGINVENGGQLALRRGAIVENVAMGIFVGGAGALAEVSDLAIRATRPGPDDTRGLGVQIGGGSRLEAARLTVEGHRTVGINVIHEGSSLDAEDLIVRGTSAQLSDDTGGQGIFVTEGASASIRRGFFADNQHVAISSFLEGASLTAEDVIVIDTRSRESDGGGGAGAFATMGGELVLRRAWVATNHTTGVGGFDGVTLTLEDVVIRDTEGQASDGLGGAGVLADLGTVLTLRRARIEANRMVGVFAGEGVAGTIEDVRVVNTRGQSADGLFGRGIEAIAGATLTVARAELVENRGAGLIAFDSETRIDATDLRVVMTAPFDCAPMGCPGAGFGVATRSARISIDRFRLADNELAGAQVTRGGVLTLTEGEIVGHPIGINVQGAAFEEGTILEGVTLEDNERNVDAQSLPIPEPAEPPLTL